MLKKEVGHVSKEGKIYHIIHHPEFLIRDILQVMIGASILAIPVGFTEETWELGGSLPWLNVMGLLTLSILFISTFVYYHYYGKIGVKKHIFEFTKRVVSTYVLSFLVVAIILTLIQRTPWTVDLAIAIKRTIIVTFPSSMSAVVADVIR